MTLDYVDKNTPDGTLIGKSQSSKVGLYGVDPVAQQVVAQVTESDAGNTYNNDARDLINDCKDQYNALVDALVAIGLVKT